VCVCAALPLNEAHIFSHSQNWTCALRQLGELKKTLLCSDRLPLDGALKAIGM
jgi:hypothetical protein